VISLPRYDYECLGCAHTFELKQSFSSEPVGICPECGCNSRRKFHAVPVIYKGSGFYTTDYARSNIRANGTGSADDSDKKEETGESKGKVEPEKSTSDSNTNVKDTPPKTNPSSPKSGD